MHLPLFSCRWARVQSIEFSCHATATQRNWLKMTLVFTDSAMGVETEGLQKLLLMHIEEKSEFVLCVCANIEVGLGMISDWP